MTVSILSALSSQIFEPR